MTQETEFNASNENDIVISGEICDKWCKVLEKIVQNAVSSALKTMPIETCAEVLITSIAPANNTVNCINLLTNERLSGIPNYSGVDLNTLSESNAFSELSTMGRRGRVFITNTQDNPIYLGLWYDEKR